MDSCVIQIISLCYRRKDSIRTYFPRLNPSSHTKCPHKYKVPTEIGLFGSAIFFGKILHREETMYFIEATSSRASVDQLVRARDY